MKKILVFLCLSLVFSKSAFAVSQQLQVIGGNWKTGQDATTAANKTITVNMTAVSGKRIVIDSIVGASNKSNSAVVIQSSSDGITYTRRLALYGGNTNISHGLASSKPVFIGQLGLYYRALLDCGAASTTVNALSVTYHEE